MADIGGLVARGDGTAAGNPNALLDGPRLNPRLGPGVEGGGLAAVDEGATEAPGVVGGLNSRYLGHLRLVSVRPVVKKS